MKTRGLLRLMVAAYAAGMLAAPAGASERVALLIGNAEYQKTSRLRNPVNDAKAMAETLRGMGFERLAPGTSRSGSLSENWCLVKRLQSWRSSQASREPSSHISSSGA